MSEYTKIYLIGLASGAVLATVSWLVIGLSAARNMPYIAAKLKKLKEEHELDVD